MRPLVRVTDTDRLLAEQVSAAGVRTVGTRGIVVHPLSGGPETPDLLTTRRYIAECT